MPRRAGSAASSSGLLREASDSGCLLVGGDSVRSAVWQLSLTAIGEVRRGKALRRDAGRPGQRLMVTGTLGRSALGLHVLEHAGPRNAAERRFARSHELPDAAYRAGPILARGGLARAAIDVSDGLLRDLGQLAAASGLGADVDLDRLPLARGFAAACRSRGLESDRSGEPGRRGLPAPFQRAAGHPPGSEARPPDRLPGSRDRLSAARSRLTRLRGGTAGSPRPRRGLRTLRAGRAGSLTPVRRRTILRA